MTKQAYFVLVQAEQLVKDYEAGLNLNLQAQVQDPKKCQEAVDFNTM